MILVTYKCDRCGHEQPKDVQMWNIGVKVVHANGVAKFGPWETSGMKMWCRQCIDALQLLGFPSELKKDEPAPAVLTLEDQIREIIRDEVEAATGARS